MIFALVCHNSFLAVKSYLLIPPTIKLSVSFELSMKGEELKNIPTSSQYTGALTFSNEHLKVHRKPKQSNFSKEQAWQKLLIQPYHSIAVTTHSVTADITRLKPFMLGKRLQQPFSLPPYFPLPFPLSLSGDQCRIITCLRNLQSNFSVLPANTSLPN